MRSTIYSFLTTILLLVPIAALPLMAVFGVPQFTPVVMSPMNEADEEEDERPARPRARSKPKPVRSDDPDFEIVEEDHLNWDEAPSKPTRLDRKLKSRERSEFARSQGARSSTTADSDSPRSRSRASGVGQRRAAPSESWEDEGDAKSDVQQASFEVAAQESPEKPFAEAGDAAQIESMIDNSEAVSFTEPPSSSPGFRRQRPAAMEPDTDAPPLKPAPNRAKGKIAQRESPTWTTAVRRLNELGIRNFRLEPGSRPSEFIFTCSVTPGNSPRVTRMFEAEADDPLKAVAKVLSQVEDWAALPETAAVRESSDGSASLDLTE